MSPIQKKITKEIYTNDTCRVIPTKAAPTDVALKVMAPQIWPTSRAIRLQLGAPIEQDYAENWSEDDQLKVKETTANKLPA